MSAEQLGLLGAWEQDQEARQREEYHRRRTEDNARSRRVSWPEWDGPAPGMLAEVGDCVVEREEGGRGYFYMEQVRLLEQRPDGRWLAVVEMGEIHGKPWHKDGTRLLLEDYEVWPPTRELWKARREQDA